MIHFKKFRRFSAPIFFPLLALLFQSGMSGTRVFPSGMEVVNVKKFGVYGNGSNDDTKALQDLIETHINHEVYLFFPKGIYLVSKPLKWTSRNGCDTCWKSGIYLIGESRDSTIIKVNSLASDSTISERAVFYMASQPGSYQGADVLYGAGDSGFRNFISNLTIDIAGGNSQAVAISFVGNNLSAITDVTLKGTSGIAGISMIRHVAGPGLIKNVSIDGFEYGIQIADHQNNMVAESLTVKNQTVCGIRNTGALLFVRRLSSYNNCPAIKNLKSGSNPPYMALVDANLSSVSGTSSETAIQNDGPGIFRNIVIDGYAVGLASNGRAMPGKLISEFVSSGNTLANTAIQKPIFSSSFKPAISLGLTVEETPEYFDTDTINWKNVQSFGVRPWDGDPNSANDQSDSINAAFASGASTVYFPPGIYFAFKTLTVGASVKHIIGNGATLSPDQNFQSSSNPEPLILFSNSNNDLRIENLDIGRYSQHTNSMPGLILIKHTSSKSLTLSHVRVRPAYGDNPLISAIYLAGANCGKLYLEDVFSSAFSGWKFSANQKIWARQLNVEGSTGTNITNDSATLWVLGVKTENEQTIIDTKNGGATEVVGGRLYTNHSTSNPAFINNESTVSLSYYQSGTGPGNVYNTQIQDIKNGSTTNLLRTDVLNLDWGGQYDSFVPLYLGYQSGSVPPRINRIGLKACEMLDTRILTTLVNCSLKY